MTQRSVPARPDWTSVSVPSGTATIAAQAAGDPAQPALLLIGGATWSRDWWPDEFCRQLTAAGLRVLRYDPRDTGGSTLYPPGEPGYSGADLIADALAVLDAFHVAKALVLGLSMGGGMAQQLAAQHPDRVAGLVLVSTSPAGPADRDLPPPTPEILATFESAEPEPDWADRDAVVEWVLNSERPYAGPGKFEEAALRELIGQIWDRTPSMASATNHFSVADDGEPLDLRGLRGVPTLVVHGSADPLLPLAHGEALAALLDAPLLTLEGAGHQVPPRDTWPELIDRIAALAAEARLT